MDERLGNHQNIHDLAQGGGKRNKHLIFSLDSMYFGIPLLQVKEIIGMANITPVPDAPSFFKGIINLRGQIISVIDLKTKLSINKSNAEVKKPCIVICEFNDIILGSIVDDVVEVFGFEESDIERQFEIQSCASREYLTGVAREKNKGLVLLLDVGKVLNVNELSELRRQSSQENQHSLKAA